MSMISDDIKERMTKEFQSSLVRNVKLVLFTQEYECPSCREVRQLVEEISALSDKITADKYDFLNDAEMAREFKIDKIPAIAFMREDEDCRIRFYGSPVGYEFKVLIDDVIRISQSDSGLSGKTRAALRSVDKPIHIQVFVTPTCPYCPGATTVAHQFALESKMISADMVEASEFPHLAQKYTVMSVPKVVVNESVEFVGALPEEKFLGKLSTQRRDNTADSTIKAFLSEKR